MQLLAQSLCQYLSGVKAHRRPGIFYTFCISFIGKMGIVVEHEFTKNVWVSGEAMNNLTMHMNMKPKYVYDETYYGSDGMQATAI